MNKVRVDVKSRPGERLELLHSFNRKKTDALRESGRRSIHPLSWGIEG